MSISAMLGGPLPSLREPPPQQQGQPHYPPSSTPSSSAAYGPTVHASPRMHSTSADFPPFRRPQTPEQPRPYDPRGSSAAASPQASHYTPEVQRYGTPQYPRGPPTDQGRDPRIPAHGIPSRPSSQPKSFPSGPPGRAVDHGRPAASDDMYPRREGPMHRASHSMEYNPERTGLKPVGYDDRYGMERDREADQRERERRERTLSMGDGGRPHPAHADYGGAGQRSQQPYGAGQPEHRDPREQHDPGLWQRQAAYDPARAPYESSGAQPRHPDDHPASSASYAGHPAPAYSQPPPDRYPPHTHAQYQGPPPQSAGPPSLRYDNSPDRTRLGPLHPQHQAPPSYQQPQPQPQHHMHQHLPPHRPREEEHQGPQYGPPNAQASLEPSRSRSNEDSAAHHMQNRGHLAVQEMNRTKGRISPLPQAVQGAQPQVPGPTTEPGIKSEFGRVFSGLGGGLGGLGVSSPVTSAPPTSAPFSGALTRRDDAEPGTHDSGPDGVKGNRGRRRKLKEEDLRDEDSAGRLTPGGRAKRPKTMPHHHHQYDINPSITPTLLDATNLMYRSHHHHHHHHHAGHNQDGNAQVGHAAGALMKGVKGHARAPSPAAHPPDSEHLARPILNAGGRPAAKRAPSPMPVIPPKPKQIVNSKAVLESVASRPRYHLGDVLYEPIFHPAKLVPSDPNEEPSRPWSSTPKPLPLDRISGNENSTITVKVPRVHLTAAAREEITARRALWGTEVYTDDSDVVAACIHGGWIRGEWDPDAGASLLDLEHGIPDDGRVHQVRGSNGDATADEHAARTAANDADFLAAPPKTGPVFVRGDRDMHVTLVILPTLRRYASTTRFGVQSREFGGEGRRRRKQHDGLSFMVAGVRWVENGAKTQSDVRGKGRKERMRRAMREVRASFGGMNVEGGGKVGEGVNGGVKGVDKENRSGEKEGNGVEEKEGKPEGEVQAEA